MESSALSTTDHQNALAHLLTLTSSPDTKTREFANDLIKLWYTAKLNAEQRILRDDVSTTIKQLSTIGVAESKIIEQLHIQFDNKVQSIL